jgi:non-heme chloroperoxidase
MIRRVWPSLLPVILLLLFFQGTAGATEEIADRYFHTSDGLRLHYLEAGSGRRVIVFVPGWLMPAAIFERQLAILSRDFRVLAFDPRSQGLSTISSGEHDPTIRTRDLNQLLTAARVDHFVLVGWSLGVLETLDYIERFRPEGLHGMILIDNSIGEGPPPKPRASRRSENLTSPQRRSRYLRDFCASMFRKPPPEAVRKAVLASALQVPPNVARQTLNQPYPRTYWRDIVEGLNVPVLYVITPRLSDQANTLRQRKGPQRTEVEIFATAGHALFVDEPERFNALVGDFATRAFANP